MCNKVKGGEGSREGPVISGGSVGADGEEVVRKHVIRRIEVRMFKTSHVIQTCGSRTAEAFHLKDLRRYECAFV
jgi:hypothetical protein